MRSKMWKPRLSNRSAEYSRDGNPKVNVYKLSYLLGDSESMLGIQYPEAVEADGGLEMWEGRKASQQLRALNIVYAKVIRRSQYLNKMGLRALDSDDFEVSSCDIIDFNSIYTGNTLSFIGSLTDLADAVASYVYSELDIDFPYGTFYNLVIPKNLDYSDWQQMCWLTVNVVNRGYRYWNVESPVLNIKMSDYYKDDYAMERRLKTAVLLDRSFDLKTEYKSINGVMVSRGTLREHGMHGVMREDGDREKGGERGEIREKVEKGAVRDYITRWAKDGYVPVEGRSVTDNPKYFNPSDAFTAHHMTVMDYSNCNEQNMVMIEEWLSRNGLMSQVIFVYDIKQAKDTVRSLLEGNDDGGAGGAGGTKDAVDIKSTSNKADRRVTLVTRNISLLRYFYRDARCIKVALLPFPSDDFKWIRNDGTKVFILDNKPERWGTSYEEIAEILNEQAEQYRNKKDEEKAELLVDNSVAYTNNTFKLASSDGGDGLDFEVEESSRQ